MNSLQDWLCTQKALAIPSQGFMLLLFIRVNFFSTATGIQENQNVIIPRGEMVNEPYLTFAGAM